jgi:hypothetical protein
LANTQKYPENSFLLHSKESKRRYQAHDPTTIDLQLSFKDFSQYIFSSSNSISEPQKLKLFEVLNPLYFSKNMDQPFTNYIVNSSHNTYLTGNQLNSTSSLKGYRRSLDSGCRCVEIDVWVLFPTKF